MKDSDGSLEWTTVLALRGLGLTLTYLESSVLPVLGGEVGKVAAEIFDSTAPEFDSVARVVSRYEALGALTSFSAVIRAAFAQRLARAERLAALAEAERLADGLDTLELSDAEPSELQGGDEEPRAPTPQDDLYIFVQLAHAALGCVLPKAPPPADACSYRRWAKSFAAREAGCPLDHCACGSHDADCARHSCSDEVAVDWRASSKLLRAKQYSGGADSNAAEALAQFIAAHKRLGMLSKVMMPGV